MKRLSILYRRRPRSRGELTATASQHRSKEHTAHQPHLPQAPSGGLTITPKSFVFVTTPSADLSICQISICQPGPSL